MKLHLGSGSVRMEGFTNVDHLPNKNVDQVVDLNKFPWPWPDNSVEEIFCAHLFEHLPDTMSVMNECHRILKPGGTLEVFVPYALSYGYFCDPTHYRPWTDATVLYFVKGTNRQEAYNAKGYELVFCNLRDDGLHVYGTVTPWTFRRWLRNLIPFRYQLREILFGMFEEVHFKLRKPQDQG